MFNKIKQWYKDKREISDLRTEACLLSKQIRTKVEHLDDLASSIISSQPDSVLLPQIAIISNIIKMNSIACREYFENDLKSSVELLRVTDDLLDNAFENWKDDIPTN